MKFNSLTLLAGVACGWTLGLLNASASLTLSSGQLDSQDGGLLVPDGNPIGITCTLSGASLGSGYVLGENLDLVSLSLELSGGNNGDLVASLTYDGRTVALLNRPGLAGDSAGIGYTTSGMNVTLSDGNYNNINTTQYPVSGSTYNPAGGSVTFQSYNDSAMNVNGGWVLYVADLSGGDGDDVSRLTGWSLDFEPVPEPVNCALAGFGLLFAGIDVGGAKHLAAHFGAEPGAFGH